ncbi:MAG: hypothetical protein ACTSX9_07845 [Candidatus Njordarchaeales archaeon]
MRKIIEVPCGTPKPSTCPYCGAPRTIIHRIGKDPCGSRAYHQYSEGLSPQDTVPFRGGERKKKLAKK